MVIPSPSSHMDCMITADVRDSTPWPLPLITSGAPVPPQYDTTLIKHHYTTLVDHDHYDYIHPSSKISNYHRHHHHHHRSSSATLNCDPAAMGLEHKMISAANYPSQYIDNIACLVGKAHQQQQAPPPPPPPPHYHYHDLHHLSSSTHADPAPAQAIGTTDTIPYLV